MTGTPETGKWIMLKKIFYGFAVILVLSAFAPRVHAEDIPPGRWWRVPFFFQQLGLTDSEKSDLDKIFDFNRQRLVELKRTVEQDRADLGKMLEQESLNENAVKAQLEKLESSRTVLAATRFSYSLEVRKLLGHDRYQELKVLYRKWQVSGGFK